jgi:hypothetical protein
MAQGNSAACEAWGRDPPESVQTHKDLVDRGEEDPLAHMQEILGHASINTTMKWAHITSNHARQSPWTPDSFLVL